MTYFQLSSNDGNNGNNPTLICIVSFADLLRNVMTKGILWLSGLKLQLQFSQERLNRKKRFASMISTVHSHSSAFFATFVTVRIMRDFVDLFGRARGAERLFVNKHRTLEICNSCSSTCCCFYHSAQ